MSYDEMCIVCGFREPTAKDRCGPCYQFLKRKGRDKTIAEVEKAWNRVIDSIQRETDPRPVWIDWLS